MRIISSRLTASESTKPFIVALALVIAAGSGVEAVAAQPPRTDTVAAREIAVRALRSFYRFKSRGLLGCWYSWNDRTRCDNAAAALDRGLDSAAMLAPRDSAVAAFRVWHRVTAGQYASADTLATEACTAGVWSAWWCSAIRGFTKYNLGDGAAADRYFRTALEGMSEERRCLWNDLSIVLNDFALTNRVKDSSCDARSELNETIWWLADPLWMVPGNERRAAHYSRWTEATLAESELNFLSYQRFPTNRIDARLEYFLRLGWLRVFSGYDLGCSQTGGRLDCQGDWNQIGDLDRYMPWAAAVHEPFTVSVFDYTFASRGGGRVGDAGAEVPTPMNQIRFDAFGELFRSRYGKMGTIQDAQTGMLLRPGGPVLLAAYDPRLAWAYHAGDRYPFLPEHNSPKAWNNSTRHLEMIGSSPMMIAVAASRGPGAEIRISRAARTFLGEVARASVQLDPETDSALVSVEGYTLLPGDFPVSTRHRFAVFRPGLGSAGAIRSSDIIMYRQSPGAAQPRNGDEALALMLPRSTISAREHVGLYWEVYDLNVGDEPEFELSLVRTEGGSLLGSVARSVGLASNVARSGVKFKAAPVRGDGIGPNGEKTFSLQLNLEVLAPGIYSMRMTTMMGADTIAVRRSVRVRG